MNEEHLFVHCNQDIVDLPMRKKFTGCKKVYKTKLNFNGIIK